MSRQTVSNVLNFPDRVATATRDRVLAAIARLGYRPDLRARNLAARRAGLLGYCLGDDGTGGAMGSFLRGLTRATEESGRHLLLFTAAPGLDGMGVYADLIAQRAVDAFVLADVVHGDPRHAWLAARGIPFASFGRTSLLGAEQPGPWVDVDGAEACARLVSGLRALGHARIAFLGWAGASGAIRERGRGCRSRCAELGLPEVVAVEAAANTIGAGECAVRLLLARPEPPTAVVAASDVLAVGALRAASAVRSELAVTGFDDSPLADAVSPALTSVRQPMGEIAEVLLALLSEPRQDRGVLLPGAIVSRASAPIPV